MLIWGETISTAATVDFGEAVLYDPLSPLAYGMRAKAYEEWGEYAEAD